MVSWSWLAGFSLSAKMQLRLVLVIWSKVSLANRFKSFSLQSVHLMVCHLSLCRSCRFIFHGRRIFSQWQVVCSTFLIANSRFGKIFKASGINACSLETLCGKLLEPAPSALFHEIRYLLLGWMHIDILDKDRYENHE